MTKYDNQEEIVKLAPSMWEQLTAEQKDLLGSTCFVNTFEKDAIIYRQGTPAAYLYHLVEGNVKVYIEGVGGRHQIVRLIKPHTSFGYRAAFNDQLHQTSAIANEHSVALLVPIETIMQLIRENNHVAQFFIRQLSYALGLADQHSVNLAQKHVRGRMAEALLRMKGLFGTKADGLTLDVYMSREDIANMSNMTTSNAIRTLSAFASEFIIAIEGKKIKIIDEQALERIARMG